MADKKAEFVEFDIWDGSHTQERDRFGRFTSIAVQFKHHGKWRVHKNDADKNFPSDFHADRVDEAEKLDLYTGSVYSKTNHKHLYDIKPKQMKVIYRDLERREEGFLDERLRQTEKFSYL